MNKPWSPGRSISIAEAAKRLGVSRRTVYYRIAAGRLQTIRTIGGSQRVLVESIVEVERDHAERLTS